MLALYVLVGLFNGASQVGAPQPDAPIASRGALPGWSPHEVRDPKLDCEEMLILIQAIMYAVEEP